jgi:hypothetical protein
MVVPDQFAGERERVAVHETGQACKRGMAT